MTPAYDEAAESKSSARANLSLERGAEQALAQLALVTGALSGIGEAYAERLARDGWDLIVVAVRHDRLDGLARRLADDYDIRARAIAADLADEGSTRQAPSPR